MRTQKRVMDIEEALRWAYREELPKGREGNGGGAFSSISPMFRGAALGGPVDNWSREPGFPAAMGDPDPDAVLIGQAVDALRSEDLNLTEFLISYRLATDFSSMDVLEAVRRDARSWVITRAKLGGRPDASAAPEVEKVLSPNGQVTVWNREKVRVEDAGGNGYLVERTVPIKAHKGGEYPKGAFSQIRFMPESRDVAHDRAVYAVWWAALDHLSCNLGHLSRLAVTGPAAPRRPWFGDSSLPAITRPVLPDLRPAPPPVHIPLRRRGRPRKAA